MKPDLYILDKKTFTKGRKEFLEGLLKHMQNALIAYGRSSVEHGISEPGYWYTEQRTKTFVTIALDKLSDGYLVQEPTVSKSKHAKKKSRGRADFYVHTGKSGYMLELKQKDVSLSSSGTINVHTILGKHEDALYDLSHFEGYSEWDVDAGFAITLGSVYHNVADDNVSAREFRTSAIKAVKDFRDFPTVHAVGIISFPDEIIRPVDWTTTQGVDKSHSYPGLLVVISVRASRKKGSKAA